MSRLNYSGRTLAFLGDAVWSYLARLELIKRGEGNGSDLQAKTIAYVSAKNQAHFYDVLHAKGFFTEEEEEYFRRGRNSNTGTIPHHTSVSVYRKSTGFEAMIGALELEQKRDRIETIWEEVRYLKEEKL